MAATYLLDTGWIIRHLRGSKEYTESMNRIGSDRLAVSLITVAELSEGIYRANDPQKAKRSVELFLSDKKLLSLTPEICDRFGRERAILRGRNQLIGDMDLFIATTALEYGLHLLTTNDRHFDRVEGLAIISIPEQIVL